MHLKIAYIFNGFCNRKKIYYMNDKVLLPKRVLKLLRYSCKFVVAVFIVYCKFLKVYVRTLRGHE